MNTGWTGGPYGTGQRMDITHTRNMVRAALNGDLRGVPTVTDPVFGVAVPTAVPGVPDEILHAARHLGGPGGLRRGGLDARARCSTTNFKAYADGVERGGSRGRPGPRRRAPAKAKVSAPGEG